MKSLLIIFYRNPELGKVKTRLAKTVGDEKAIAIYLKLASHTRTITEHLPIDKAVYYSHFIDTEDAWPNKLFQKELQRGSDLGVKMLNAFKTGFDKGYQHICIVGTDCFELNSEIIAKAFHHLASRDAVLGPAKDGGYYLLGMNQLVKQLFENKEWSTDSVASATIRDFDQQRITFSLTEMLTDVDEEKDLPRNWTN